MKSASGFLFVCGLVLSSFLTGCVAAESSIDDEEEVGEASDAVGVTMVECYQNLQTNTQDCYDVIDPGDHQVCLFFANAIFENCRQEVENTPPEESSNLVIGNPGGGYHPGFRGGVGPIVIPPP